jgi:hypothetical protein
MHYVYAGNLPLNLLSWQARTARLGVWFHRILIPLPLCFFFLFYGNHLSLVVLLSFTCFRFGFACIVALILNLFWYLVYGLGLLLCCHGDCCIVWRLHVRVFPVCFSCHLDVLQISFLFCCFIFWLFLGGCDLSNHKKRRFFWIEFWFVWTVSWELVIGGCGCCFLGFNELKRAEMISGIPCKLVCYDSFSDGWTFTLAQLVTDPMLFSTSFHDPGWFIVSVYAAICLFFFFFFGLLF